MVLAFGEDIGLNVIEVVVVPDNVPEDRKVHLREGLASNLLLNPDDERYAYAEACGDAFSTWGGGKTMLM